MAKTIGDKSIARDLCTLQINTILKDNITGGNMPEVRTALCQLSERYSSKLVEYGAQPATVMPSNTAVGGRKRFLLYQSRAQALIDKLDSSEQSDIEKLNMLQRIKNNSERICQILSHDDNELSPEQIQDKLKQNVADNDLDLSRADYVSLRKFWELGTEQIVMQTVIEIDGDVTTRIKSKYADNGFATIHGLHNDSVNLSYNYWKSLITMVASVFESLIKPLLSGGRS